MKSLGFTLIETMLALLMLVVGLLAVAHVFTGSLRANYFSATISLASGLATEKLEQLKSRPFTNAQLNAGGNLTSDQNGYFDYLNASGTTGGDSAYVRRWQITNTSTSLKTITVRVTTLGTFAVIRPTVTYSTIRSNVQ